MITPRHTRLIRVRTLRAFHRAIARCGCSGDPGDIRSSAVIVSTHAAAEELRCTLENLLLGAPGDGASAVAWPDILTRDDWYERLQAASASAPRQLSAIEREVLMARAARVAVAAGDRPPFEVRPPIVAEMVRFFDTMLRLGRTLDGFERLATEELEGRVPIDRGAAQLLAQTRFLAASFRGYAESVRACGAHDEHLLRAHLMAQSDPPPFTTVVVTVGDRSCSAHGLWPADFDLLSRLPHLARIDIVATENVLAAGFLERLHDLLPGFEEEDFADDAGMEAGGPVLVRAAGSEVPWWVSRDREEEIAAIARRIKGEVDRSDGGHRSPDTGLRIAVVCKRPLPYLYLAQSCFSAAGIPFQAYDDLPLAAEPFAAAVDLAVRFVESGFGRRQGIALLRSPHFVFPSDEGELNRDSITALEAALREGSHDADAASLEQLAERWRLPGASTVEASAVPAAIALARAARSLDPLRRRQPASAQFDLLVAFLDAHGAPSHPVAADRARRARTALVNALRDLALAHRRHDDPVIDFAEVSSRLRRWIESQTFSPQTGRGGVHLVDADAARYGDFHDTYLVGVIEREWPDTEGRTIFYPLSLLNRLGWPPERLRLTAARAAFTDLLRLAFHRVAVSVFVLEDDGLVEPSPFLDELDRAGLGTAFADGAADLRIVPEDALSLDPVRTDVLQSDAREWADLRVGRSAGPDPRFHGCVTPVPLKSVAVSRLDMYLDCPFRYFAEAVLGLRDETDDDPAEGPRAQGKFLHETLAAFYEAWRARGRGAVTCDNMDGARAQFAEIVEARLAPMKPAESILWRARLLGSAARAGVGEVVLRAEAATGETVMDRFLEQRLDGPCRLVCAEAESDPEHQSGQSAARPTDRTIELRAVADRIDLLTGSRFRVIDYKLGRAPDVRRMVQLPLYALRAAQQLAAAGREDPRVVDAQYFAFGEREPIVGLRSRGTIDDAIADGQARALAAIEGIERGAFPPQPAQSFKCTYCPFAGVCRQDYVDG